MRSPDAPLSVVLIEERASALAPTTSASVAISLSAY